VVPTLGKRPALLRQCLGSVTQQDMSADITVVVPVQAAEARAVAQDFGARILDDPGGQAKAINLGVQHAKQQHLYVNWLGDDDLLEPGSLTATAGALDADAQRVLAYGACRYIDELGQELWISRAGRWAPRILSWGPDLIPQPGMLIRASAWRGVGGLDTSYRLAFDLDLLLRLKRVGPLIDCGAVVSSFRWHADSLTVDDRGTNLAESERAKRMALSPGTRRIAWVWERPVRIATRMAAREVGRRARRLGAG
jgi:GT2 family glycosyltransferase